MQSKVIYREVREQDNALLADMIREVFREHDAPQAGTVYSDPTTDKLYQLFRTPGSLLRVAETDKTPLGCCGIYPTEGLDPDCTELVKFYLSQDARGKGIGRTLMQQCIVAARERGYKRLYLESLPHFSKAVNIYTRLGFQILEQPLGRSGHTGCTIWMVLDL